MGTSRDQTVQQIEVVEDFTASAKCDEGFLHVRRLRCRNRRTDGSASNVYRVDMVDRPRVDAVGVLAWRRAEGGVEVLTRMNLRPAAYFRKDKDTPLPDGRSHLFVEEIIAGLMEREDRGEAGIRQRAAAETEEEGGIQVSADEVTLLGGPIFLAPGILSEKVHLCAVEVTGKPQGTPKGDGTPLEEGGVLRWRPLQGLIDACRSGEIQDAKTEVAAARLQATLKS